MLALERADSAQPLANDLAGLLALLAPGPGPAVRTEAERATRRWARQVLADVRHHLREHSLIVQALGEAAPAAVAELSPIEGCHRRLRELSADLCHRIRARDIPGARAQARTLLALFLQHGQGEQRELARGVRKLDPAACRRFAEVLFGLILFEASGRPVGGRPKGRAGSLQSLYSRVLGHLRSSPGVSPHGGRS